jgi:hypothetical protein
LILCLNQILDSALDLPPFEVWGGGFAQARELAKSRRNRD